MLSGRWLIGYADAMEQHLTEVAFADGESEESSSEQKEETALRKEQPFHASLVAQCSSCHYYIFDYTSPILSIPETPPEY